MARFYIIRVGKDRGRVLFWIGEFAAGCAFVFLMIALLSAPYLLGWLTHVDAEVVRGVRP